MGEPRDRSAIWIAAASALHVAAFVAVAFLPTRGPRFAQRSDVPSEIEIAIEQAVANPVDVPEPAPVEPAPEREPSPSDEPAAALARAATPAAMASSRPGVLGGEGVPGPTSSGGEPTAVPPGNGVPGDGVSPLAPTPEQLGLGGIGRSNPFLPRRGEPEPDLTKPRREKMRATGLAHDTQLGLGPEGPALTALSDSTRTSMAPLQGRATFLVRSDRDGLVSSIDLIDSEGGGGWLEAGKLAFEALKAKRFRVPEGANGLAMRIEVTSGMKLPNGQDSPVGTRRGSGGMPEMLIPDVSNIGASPRRVVKSRIVSTEAL